MPLKAIIENTEIISTFLTKNDWLDLMNRVKSENIDVIISQTSKKGYLRTSKTGIQHFVHKKGEKPEYWKPESPEHLFIKNEILLACKDANWSASPEFSENDWEADVLTTKNHKRIAFEVQLSYQTLDKTIERQDKFIRDKVRGCWFFKRIPKGLNQLDANNNIPFFKVTTNIEKKIEVEFYDKKIPISKFINYLLEGKIKYSDTITPSVKQKVKLKIFKLKCSSCGTIWNNYIVEGELNTNCNLKIPLDESFFVKKKFKHHPDILAKLKELEKDNKFIEVSS